MMPVGFFFPPWIHPETAGGMSRNALQPRYPLIEELQAMDKNQGIALPCCDHFRGNNGLAKGCGGCEHAGVMLEKSRGGRTLFRR